MDQAKDEAINKLIAGQEKMENDISVLKTDVSKLKVDVSGLKQGQQNLETMMLKMMEEMTFIKKVVINIENTFKPQVKTLFDADKSRQHETTDLKHICREQEERLEDHEINVTNS